MGAGIRRGRAGRERAHADRGRPELRTVALWVDPPSIRAAVRPRGGTFGEPFDLDDGNPAYVPDRLDAVGQRDGEVVAAWSGPADQELRIRSLKPSGDIADARAPEIGGGRPAIAANAAGMVAVAYWSLHLELRLAIRPAGATSFEPSIPLMTVAGFEDPGPLDVTVRNDGQVAVAAGTDIVNPPGGTARMLIARRAPGGATSLETVDSVTFDAMPPAGQTQTASFRGAMELLPDGRQLLVYRVQTVGPAGIYNRKLRGGPRDGLAAPAPPVLEDAFGPAFGPTQHDLVVDDARRPWLWWRHGTGSGEEELRVRQSNAAGAFPAAHQVLASPAFGTVEMAPFGNGRTGVLFTQGGEVKASTSVGGAAFGAPHEVATPAAVTPSPGSVALAGAGEGSAVALWPDGAAVQNAALRATPFDATKPTVESVQAPASLTVGVPGTFTAAALDDWSVPSVSWLFSGGGTLPGATVQRAFATVGTFFAAAVAADAVGNTVLDATTVEVTAVPPTPFTPPPPLPPPPPAPGPDRRAPVLSGVRLAPSTLRSGRRSTTLHFRLDEAASVLAQVERVRSGFRSAGRCVRARPKSGKPKTCTRYVRAGSPVQRSAGAGAGRLTIRRPSAKGRYRVLVYAVDAAGNRSAAKRPALTVR